MNAYPSWIHRIPEMLEALALADRERIDRPTAEWPFDLRKTAAFHMLQSMGAEPVGHSLVISDGAIEGGAGASAMALGNRASKPHP